MTASAWSHGALNGFQMILLAILMGREIAAQELLEKQPIKPNFTAMVLKIGKSELKPLATYEAWSDERDVGEYVIRIKEDLDSSTIYEVECLERATRKRIWRQELPAEEDYECLGEHAGYVLFSKDSKRNDASEDEEADCVVERFQLSDGKRIDPLLIPLDAKTKKLFTRVVSLFKSDDDLIVLSVADKDSFPEAERQSYRITRFEGKSSKVVWSKEYPSGGTREFPGAVILGGGRGPGHDNEGIQAFSPIGANLLVCAGPLEDLMLLNPIDGAAIWTMPRVWEYRRGFIGPSVWSHYIGPHGLEESTLSIGEMTLDEYRKEVGDIDEYQLEYFKRTKEQVKAAKERSAAHSGWILAGPIVGSRKHGDIEYGSILLATAQADKDDAWPNFLADCVLYELSLQGNVLATAKLPRFVNGRDFAIVKDRLNWFCDGGFILDCQRAASDYHLIGSDCLIDFEWRRISPVARREGWYRNGTGPLGAAISGCCRFDSERGGFVATETSKVYEFPVVVRDLAANTATEIILQCPFEGEIPIPTENYSQTEDEGGKVHWTKYGDEPLVLDNFRIRGDRFEMTLESNSKYTAVAFDLKSVLEAAKAAAVKAP